MSKTEVNVGLRDFLISLLTEEEQASIDLDDFASNIQIIAARKELHAESVSQYSLTQMKGDFRVVAVSYQLNYPRDYDVAAEVFDYIMSSELSSSASKNAMGLN